MKFIYLASPYSAKPQENYERVLEFVYYYCLDNDVILFSPIIYGHNIVDYGALEMGATFETWQDFDLMMLSKADELWVLKLDGWETSKGVKKEIEFAENNGIIIKYVEV